MNDDQKSFTEEQRDCAYKAKQWWLSLQGGEDAANNGRKINSAALAKLRRATSPLMAMMEPEAMTLVQKIAGTSRTDQLRVLELASLLSHVREDTYPRTVAASLGGYEEDSRIMKSARFHRLMLSTQSERGVAMRRAIQMLKGKANVQDVAYAWLVWDYGSIGESMRIEWMFRYVGANSGDQLAANKNKAEETNNAE